MLDEVKVLKTTEIKRTQKKHECADCGKMIEKGSEATNSTFRYDGRLFSVYFCNNKCK